MIVDRLLAKTKFEKDSLPLLQRSDKYLAYGIRILKVEFPVIEVSLWWRTKKCELRLRTLADDYDYLPIQSYWIEEDGSPLLNGKGLVPIGMGFQTDGSHPHGLKRAWFCFPGWREYHDHESHQNIAWATIRKNPQYRIPGIILQLNSDLNRITSAT